MTAQSAAARAASEAMREAAAATQCRYCRDKFEDDAALPGKRHVVRDIAGKAVSYPRCAAAAIRALPLAPEDGMPAEITQRHYDEAAQLLDGTLIAGATFVIQRIAAALARRDMPVQATAEPSAMREAIERIPKWKYAHGLYFCLGCEAEKNRQHSQGCWVGALLAALSAPPAEGETAQAVCTHCGYVAEVQRVAPRLPEAETRAPADPSCQCCRMGGHTGERGAGLLDMAICGNCSHPLLWPLVPSQSEAERAVVEAAMAWHFKRGSRYAPVLEACEKLAALRAAASGEPQE